MFVVLYRWRIKEGFEQEFIDSWAKVTDYIVKNCNSLGSRLHKDKEGLFYGYAQWESAEQRENAFKSMPKLDSRIKMQNAIKESLPEIILEVEADYLIFPIDNKN